ncbi:MAG TPA: substrate-binding domain-containing protein [Rhizomicrobium sp.]|nr:substrate-binding domain-containing protein [Rhizomicrobium sp.]
MRSVLSAAILAVLLASAAQAAEIRVISPGVISNSGLREVAAAFTKKTGVNVIIVGSGMGQIVNRIKTENPAPDVPMLPMELMGRLALDGGLVPNSFTPLGRVEIGLFKKPDAPAPDISTIEKLIAAMKTASVVFYSDPVSGSMQAGMNDRLLKRPDFAGIHGQPVRGDAEPALRHGEGDGKAMGLGLIHGVHSPDNKPTDNPYLVGMLPAELEMHMDMAAGVSVRSADVKDSRAFIQFVLSPEMRPVWESKGTDRY